MAAGRRWRPRLWSRRFPAALQHLTQVAADFGDVAIDCDRAGGAQGLLAVAAAGDADRAHARAARRLGVPWRVAQHRAVAGATRELPHRRAHEIRELAWSIHILGDDDRVEEAAPGYAARALGQLQLGALAAAGQRGRDTARA